MSRSGGPNPPILAAIGRSTIALAPLSFEWNAQLHPWLSDGANTAFIKRASTLSGSAVLGLGAATGEWLAYRFRQHEVDPRLPSFIECAWTAATHFDPPVELDVLGPRTDDPVQCVIAEYTRLFRDAVAAARKQSRFSDAIESIVRLGDYVIPGTAFKNWRKKVIARLATLTGKYPSGRALLKNYEIRHQSGWKTKTPLDDIWGPPVPRDVFDE